MHELEWPGSKGLASCGHIGISSKCLMRLFRLNGEYSAGVPTACHSSEL